MGQGFSGRLKPSNKIFSIILRILLCLEPLLLAAGEVETNSRETAYVGDTERLSLHITLNLAF